MENKDHKQIIFIDSGLPGPGVLISAGVHGDEYEPMLAVMELATEVSSLLRAGSVTLIPVVNATAYQTNSRYGEDGLDLARICPGRADGSSSETAAAMISSHIQQADYYIDLHTGGKLFNIYPLAGYMLHPVAAVLEEQRNMARAFNLPLIWGTEGSPDGRTLSIARDANVPAIYIEYGGGNSVKEEIAALLKEGCLNVLNSLSMIKLEGENSSCLKYWVEDYTPGGGYLQGKFPSPASGIFIAATVVGANVNKGQLWGNVVNPVTHQRTEIIVAEAGIALFVRDAAYVKEGEALGGILPVSASGKLIINGK
ncbi:succinylglutamate desuccinylase/aspartoacylase family protein [Pedobacter heparinus]|uniref:Succinylglutamate desuccinylase/aspartoacylase n=1 Tax=Pedobacter heparinus (strain ATCC 13125 / DSM 2366 / CIP 104194 / JCM 7457 / NBRC 12017 / NCIMB 9290 / NRRL B-14731 / HIM 762-3) TaxID=485917 RepID=C6XTI9_PEDHD|nr:M14 family metallopeptidase [Pedobacter heparinus]ACU05767.1 Succinylglutamate desuccinylase/aspartoacylase [Pedobacter heparinus DSM 2366]